MVSKEKPAESTGDASIHEKGKTLEEMDEKWDILKRSTAGRD